MTTFLTRYAEAIAVAATLALAAMSYSAAQIPADGDGAGRTSQYCAPQEESWPTQKIYCRAGPG